MSHELPQICPPDKHVWVSLTTHGCGYGSGDQVVQEMFVIGQPELNGGSGTVCNNCFQIYDAPSGVRALYLIHAYNELSSYDVL